MLADNDAMATVAVKNLEAAKEFYGGKLGLKEWPGDPNPEVAAYKSGGSTLLVYRSEYAGTNKATSVTWSIKDDLEPIVAELKSKGIAFEHYDMPGITRQGDIHTGGGMSVAWFKDPEGNILSIVRPSR